MRQVEGSALVVVQRQLQRVALAEFDQRRFASLGGPSPGFGNLFGAAFDAEHQGRRSGGPSPPRQLTQAAANIDDALPAGQPQLAQ